jgi:hypothetical protein
MIDKAPIAQEPRQIVSAKGLLFPEKSRFSIRTSEWYDLTARYRKQLFDLDKKEYLTSKTKEHMNQVMLQRQTATGVH